MIIGGFSPVGFPAPLPRQPAAASSSAPTESADISSFAYKGARWPDLNPILQGPDRLAAVKKSEETLEAWLSHNIPPADPAEKPFWTGLARWMARDMVDQARPDWQSGSLDDARHAITLWNHEEGDPQPLRGEKGDPEKAVGFFRMMEGFLGDVRFRTRLASFLQSNDGKPARAADLFHSFGLDETPLDGWLDNPGFPMVHAQLDGKKVKLSQERMFLYNDGQSDAKWSVPLRIRYKDGEQVREFKTILTEKETEVTLPAKAEVAWIYPNGGGKGFYRTDVAPPPEELGKLRPAERLAVLSNQWRLVRHKAAPVGTFLDQVEATRGDTDPSRLKIVLTELRFLAPLARDRGAFDQLVLSQVGPAFEQLGPEPKPDEPMHDAKLRIFATMMLARAGHAGAQAVARQWGERYLAGDQAITPEQAAYSDSPQVAEALIGKLGQDADFDVEALRGLLINPAHVDRTVEYALQHPEPAMRFLGILNPFKALELMENRWDDLPGREALVEVSGLSPVRPQVEKLVAERGSDSLRQLWERVKTTDPQAVNMADLPDRLDEWLQGRKQPTALGWNLVG